MISLSSRFVLSRGSMVFKRHGVLRLLQIESLRKRVVGKI